MYGSTNHNGACGTRHAIDGACIARLDRVTEKTALTSRSRRDRTPRRRRVTARRRTWLVWVDGYLRSDGVRVAGHYRACVECPKGA